MSGKKGNAMRHDLSLIRPAGARGFLLLVIIGVLALMLTICIGFISMTRGELQGVLAIRDRADGLDVARSALDWNIGVISKDLFDTSGQYDNAKYVTNARTGGDYKWWYRPYELGMKDVTPTWPIYKNFGTMAGLGAGSKAGYPYYYNDSTRTQARPDCIDPAGKDQAEWTWLPPDHFPNNTRGRFMTLVWDPNSLPCLNDWLEDSNPTQCQMAHMIRDGYGEQFVERAREWRDGGSNIRSGTFVPGSGNVSGGTAQPQRVPLRYHEAWRVASRTLRYMHWNSGYGAGGFHRWMSPNWVTTNSTYFSNFAAEMYGLKSGLVADGILMNKTVPQQTLGGLAGRYYPPTPAEGYVVNTAWWFPPSQPETFDTKWTQSFLPVGMPFSNRAYVDPDTGRAPVNVNTTYNSGERLPQNIFNGTPVFSMEAVFNVDSLKRIIQIGSFQFDWNFDENIDPATETFTVNYTAADPLGTIDWAPLNGFTGAELEGRQELAKIKLEELKTKLAYQYQETLCRYFTATYRHPMTRKYPPFFNGNPAVVQTVEDFSEPGRFNDVYGIATEHHCKEFDYSITRFAVPLDGPNGVASFRWNVYQDFNNYIKMTGPVTSTWDPATKLDTFNITQGRVDARTLIACYDNIVPGKPPFTRNFSGDVMWGSANDPLLQLYNAKVGRDELVEDSFESGFTTLDTSVTPAGRPITTAATKIMDLYNLATVLPAQKALVLRYSRGVLGHHSDDPQLFDGGNSTFDPADPVDIKARASVPALRVRYLNLRPKGADIKGVGQVPWRQLAFGPDWFSTELTTTSTTFVMIVTAQLIDAESIVIDPTRPRDFFSGQWGFCVELAPDVRVETPQAYDGNNWHKPESADVTEIGLGFYRGQNMDTVTDMRWPEYLKKARTTDAAGATGQQFKAQFPAEEESWFYSMDTKCSTLKTMYNSKTSKFDGSDAKEQIPDNQFQLPRGSVDNWNLWRNTANSPDCWLDPDWGRSYQNESAARNWTDFRGVRKDHIGAYYTGTPAAGGTQTTKRVVIRGAWSHNQGTNK